MGISGITKEGSGRIGLSSYELGVIGTFPEYPVADQLSEIAPTFKSRQNYHYSGRRQKFELDLVIDGVARPFFVKAKTDADDDSLKYQQDVFRRFKKWRDKLRELDPASPTAAVLKANIKLIRSEEVAYDSATKELMLAREASWKYQQTYGEPLSIEKGVGFVSNKDWRKWTIFEKIRDVVRLGDFSRQDGVQVERRGNEFVDLMKERLLAVGIYPTDLIDRRLAGVVITGNPADISSVEFVLVDTEDWCRVG